MALSPWIRKMRLSTAAGRIFFFVGFCCLCFQLKTNLLPRLRSTNANAQALDTYPVSTKRESVSQTPLSNAMAANLNQAGNHQRPFQSVRPKVMGKMSNSALEMRFLARQALLNCGPPKKPVRPVKRPSYAYFGNEYYEVYLMRKVASTFLEEITRNVSHNQSHFGYTGKPGVLLLTVRDPYTRLASSYIDRVLTNQFPNRLFGPLEVKKFWPNATALQAQARCLNVISFQQFAKYYIYAHRAKNLNDAHFMTMSSLYDPCHAKIDFILHLETLIDDLSYIFTKLKINASVVPTDDLFAIHQKPKLYKEVLSVPAPCQSMCSAYRNLWWSYHARGLILRDIPFPLPGPMCDKAPTEKFTQIALDAYHRTKPRSDKSIQKRQIMVELFLQLPLNDRIKIRDILAKDFQMFGYDPQPADLFPELVKGFKV